MPTTLPPAPVAGPSSPGAAVLVERKPQSVTDSATKRGKRAARPARHSSLEEGEIEVLILSDGPADDDILPPRHERPRRTADTRRRRAPVRTVPTTADGFRRETTSTIAELLSFGVPASYLLFIGVSRATVAVALQALGLELPPLPPTVRQKHFPLPPRLYPTPVVSRRAPTPALVVNQELLDLEAQRRAELVARRESRALQRRNLIKADSLTSELDALLSGNPSHAPHPTLPVPPRSHLFGSVKSELVVIDLSESEGEDEGKDDDDDAEALAVLRSLQHVFPAKADRGDVQRALEAKEEELKQMKMLLLKMERKTRTGGDAPLTTPAIATGVLP